MNNEMVKAECTLVTAYYHIHPARPSNFYEGFITTMMELKDPMVIFTSPDKVDMIKEQRSHLPENRTTIIPIDFDDVQVSEKYPDLMSEEILKKDSKHRYGTVNRWKVIKIWHAKTWFVTKAMEMNVFNSNKFLWLDIGHFRNPREDWKGRTLIAHPEVIPDDRMLMQATKRIFTVPRRPDNAPWLRIDQHYVSGSAIAGHRNTWPLWYDMLQETWKGLIDRGISVADDQHAYLNSCLTNPDLCAFTTLETQTYSYPHPLDDPAEMLGEDTVEFHGGKTLWHYWGSSYFTFKFVLYHGADPSQFWYPYKDGDSELSPMDTQESVRHLITMIQYQEAVRKLSRSSRNDDAFRSIDSLGSLLNEDDLDNIFGSTIFRLYSKEDIWYNR